jgi:hypothetical protein
MGALFVSASEIETYDLCNRRWAFIYIEGKRPPPNDSAALGTRVHAILEKWLRDGTAPDTWTPEGEIAASGLHLLPAPKTPTLVTEEEFRFTSRRAWYLGYKDFRYRDASGLLHVGDHKTTKSMVWAKSTDEILAHPQALIYAVDEFFKNPNDDRLALDWIYYKTTGSRKAEPRFQIVTKDVVAEMFFEHVDPVAGEITQLHHEVPVGTSALDFRPDFRACDAFGGCAFLSICNPTPTQRMQATMTQAGLSLTDKLKAMKANRPPSPIHPPEAYQAPVVEAGPPAPSVPAFSLPVVGQPALPFPQAAPAPQAVPQAPQAAPVPQAAQVTTPGPVPAPQAVSYIPDTSAPVPQAAAPAPKKPRGRPPKATSVAELPQMNGIGFTLYVGCAPIGCNVTNALEYVNAAHDQLRQARGVTHYRELEFGRGPGELCAALEALLALCEGTENAPSGDVVLGGAQIEEDTASVWFSKAAKVVRAFR